MANVASTAATDPAPAVRIPASTPSQDSCAVPTRSNCRFPAPPPRCRRAACRARGTFAARADPNPGKGRACHRVWSQRSCCCTDWSVACSLCDVHQLPVGVPLFVHSFIRSFFLLFFPLLFLKVLAKRWRTCCPLCSVFARLRGAV